MIGSATPVASKFTAIAILVFEKELAYDYERNSVAISSLRVKLNTTKTQPVESAG